MIIVDRRCDRRRRGQDDGSQDNGAKYNQTDKTNRVEDPYPVCAQGTCPHRCVAEICRWWRKAPLSMWVIGNMPALYSHTA